jgi:hypothetical protein
LKTLRPKDAAKRALHISKREKGKKFPFLTSSCAFREPELSIMSCLFYRPKLALGAAKKGAMKPNLLPRADGCNKKRQVHFHGNKATQSGATFIWSRRQNVSQ